MKKPTITIATGDNPFGEQVVHFTLADTLTFSWAYRQRVDGGGAREGVRYGELAVIRTRSGAWVNLRGGPMVHETTSMPFEQAWALAEAVREYVEAEHETPSDAGLVELWRRVKRAHTRGE